MKKLLLTGCGLIVLAAVPLRAQEKVTVPFRDPGMPKKLVVDGMIHGATITGYDGNDVIVESTGGDTRNLRPRTSRNTPPAGLRRIGGNNMGLDVVEENNTVTVKSGPFMGNANLRIQVPRQASVTVKTMGGDGIRIENIAGEIEANNMNGEVNIVNASGSVVAHSMNGKVIVSLNSVAADKPMSFSTMNGDIDVTLPANSKAKVKMKTNHGEMYTDFDVQLDSSAPTTTVQDDRKKGGRYRVRVDSALSGSINGGGPEFQFTTFNGDILLRKK